MNRQQRRKQERDTKKSGMPPLVDSEGNETSIEDMPTGFLLHTIMQNTHFTLQLAEILIDRLEEGDE